MSLSLPVVNCKNFRARVDAANECAIGKAAGKPSLGYCDGICAARDPAEPGKPTILGDVDRRFVNCRSWHYDGSAWSGLCTNPGITGGADTAKVGWRRCEGCPLYEARFSHVQRIVVDPQYLARIGPAFYPAATWRPQISKAVAREAWPLLATALEYFARPGDRGLGDTAYRMLRALGARWAANLSVAVAASAWNAATGSEWNPDCGCEARRQHMNELYPLGEK